MANDDMERSERYFKFGLLFCLHFVLTKEFRITKSNLENIEYRYYNSLEKIALLEADLNAREDIQIELQRTKVDLRESQEELSVANHKIQVLTAELQRQKEPNKTPDLSRKYSRSSFKGISESRSVSKSSSDYTQMPGMGIATSRSLKKIHGMLDQMKNLESRVANFKSSLPKPVTPNKNSVMSTSPPRPRSRLSARTPTESHRFHSRTPTESSIHTEMHSFTPVSKSSHVPVHRFRPSPSLSTLSTDNLLDRVKSPPQRARSSVGHNLLNQDASPTKERLERKYSASHFQTHKIVATTRQADELDMGRLKLENSNPSMHSSYEKLSRKHTDKRPDSAFSVLQSRQTVNGRI